ncbi:hypothetical protein JXB31_00530 [Candidatus Woesearchaeota archaeon]|nr:hypothetical protein [Candidatus Woesearchaeota archaeon]
MQRLLDCGCYLGIYGSFVYDRENSRDIDVILIAPIKLDLSLRELILDNHTRKQLIRDFLTEKNPEVDKDKKIDEFEHQWENIPELNITRSQNYMLDSGKGFIYDSLFLYGQLMPKSSWIRDQYESFFGDNAFEIVYERFRKYIEESRKGPSYSQKNNRLLEYIVKANA